MKTKRIVLAAICLVVACIVGIVIGIALCSDKKSTTKAGDKDLTEQLADQKIESIFNDYYRYVMNQDMFDSLDKGYHEISDEYKMYVATTHTMPRNMDCYEVAANDKHFKASEDDEYGTISYEYKADENSEAAGYTITCEEDGFFDYTDVNDIYKSMFNGEASKKSFGVLRTYFVYVPNVNGFVSGFANIGCSGCFEPIISIKDYEVKNNKLYIKNGSKENFKNRWR